MTTLALTQCFTIQTDGVFADTIDGEVIIVNVKNGIYYSVTALGAEIWGHLQERLSLGQIVDRLMARYAEDRAKLGDWVLRFAAELEAEALVVRTASAAAMASVAAVDAIIQPSAMAMIEPPSLMKYSDLGSIVLLSSILYDRTN